MKKMIWILMAFCVVASFGANWTEWNTGGGWPWWWDNYHVEMQNPAYGWFCGNHGTIARWEDNTWQLSSVPGIYPIRSISAIDDSSAWAVGDAGLILKYEGTEWVEKPSPTTRDLRDIHMINSTTGWAIGNQVLLRCQSGNWTVYNQSGISGIDWQGIWASDINNVWICGANGQVAYWSSNHFVSRNLPVSQMIYGIWVNSNTDAWVCTYNGYIYHWEGIGWSGAVYSSGSHKLLTIAFTSLGYGWCAGEAGELFKWNGVTWNDYPSPTGTDALFSISMLAEDYGWIVGGNGTILYIDGTTVENKSLGNVRAMYR